MATVLDCAKLARAAYGDVPAGDGWVSLGANHMAGGGLHGSFQGMAFSQGNTVVFALKGTAVNARTGAGDLLADLKLGVGRIPFSLTKPTPMSRTRCPRSRPGPGFLFVAILWGERSRRSWATEGGCLS